MSTARKKCQHKPPRKRPTLGLPRSGPTPEAIGAPPDKVAELLAERVATGEPELCDCDDMAETWSRCPADLILLHVSHPTTCRWAKLSAADALELKPGTVTVLDDNGFHRLE
jgi:hypothetical protein